MPGDLLEVIVQRKDTDIIFDRDMSKEQVYRTCGNSLGGEHPSETACSRELFILHFQISD